MHLAGYLDGVGVVVVYADGVGFDVSDVVVDGFDLVGLY